jgi:hypothetical protein
VGNSGSLLRRKYGSVIDKHDQVLRINQAPVVGHERAVGSRTSHRVLNTLWSTRYANNAMMQKPGQARGKDRRLVPRLPREDSVTLVVVSRTSDATAALRFFQSHQLRRSEEYPAVRSMILEPKAVEWASAVLRDFRECAAARHKVRFPNPYPCCRSVTLV